MVTKLKMVGLRWNLVPRLIQISKIQWWCLLFPLSTDQTPFWLNFVQKPKLFRLKFLTYNNSNKFNSMVMFTFYVFHWKYSFQANLVQKIKIFTLSWNLVPRLIWICWFNSEIHFFLFSTENILYKQICSKNSKLKFGS